MNAKTVAVMITLLLVVGVMALAAPPGPAPAPPAPEADLEEEKILYVSPGGSWLGVSINDISADRAKDLGLKEETGVEIGEVIPGSPAAEAGLEKGDVILRYQENRVDSAAQLVRLVRETPAGRTVSLQTVRAGTTRTVKVRVAEHHGPRMHRGPHGGWGPPPHIEIPDIVIPEIPDLPDFHAAPSRVRLGAQVEPLTDQLAEFFGVRQGSGVLVRSVLKGGVGEAAGLKAGDVIVRVDDETIADPHDLRAALRARSGKSVTVTVIRDRKEKALTATLPKPEGPGEEGETRLSPEQRRDIEDRVRQAHDRAREARDRARALQIRIRALEQGSDAI